ncbi:MAG: ketose-bisphosphate aldolase [bacterium]
MNKLFSNGLTYRQTIENARAKKISIGHFNISNLEGLRGIVQAAIKLNVPVIIGVSEGERDFVGVKQTVALVQAYRDQYNNHPIFLNADHTYSFERVKEAIDAGFDSAIIDGAKLPMDQNIIIAKQSVEYAKLIRETTGRDVVIEGEIGYIGTSSKILDAIPEGVTVSSVAEAKAFVDATGVDMLAPAVGNVHGILRSGVNPALNIKRIKEISEATNMPMVLHGASGISSSDLESASENGMTIVHYNTELRIAFRNAVRDTLAKNPDEVAPYKIMATSIEAVQKVVEEKLKIMNRIK